MADNTSTVQFKADISQLKSAMQAAQRQVRLASSEFKAATAGLDDWSKSATGLQAKLKQLDTTLSAQKKQVELANEEYEKTVKLYGENSAEADRAKMKLNGYEAAVAKTEKEIDQYNDELKKAEKYGDNYADSLDEMEAAQEKASEGFTVMKGALASLVADGIRLAIDGMKELAKQTLEAGMNFEQGMAQVQAISGASAEEMDALTAKAKEMGATTKFSATESAEAFNYMAMAGWDTEDMINGISGVMNLAAASGADLATTSDIVTDALTAMGYSAGDATKLADVMAAASSNANTNVEMMGQTFQYAAPIIGALGYNMEDAAVQIGLMANAGIKGTKAGTALRSILSRLSAPPSECAKAMDILGLSLRDSEGNMKSLDEVIHDLRVSFGAMNEVQKTSFAKAIAGQEAMSGLLAIVNAAPEDYEKLTKAVQESEGASKSMADTMNNTVEGQLTLLKSQVEGIQIQIYEKLMPSLRDGIDKISETLSAVDWDDVGDKLGDFANKAIDLFIKIVDNGDGIVDILKAIGTALIATFVITKVASFAQAIMGMVKTFQALKAATDIATSSQLLLNAAQAATPIGLVVAGVAALAAGLIYLASKNKEAAESTQVLTEFEEQQIDKINELAQSYKELQSARDENVKAVTSEFGYYQELATELDGLVDSNGAVKEGYEERVNFILNTLRDACGVEMELVDGVIQNYQEEKQAIEQLIETKKAEAILSANEELYTTAIQNKDDALKNLTTAQGIYKQNISDMQKAESDYNNLLNTSVETYAKQNDLTYDMGAAAQQLAHDQEELKQKFIDSKAAVGESRVAMGNAQKTYDDYMATIQNYEGLSAAIIGGDAEKIQAALTNMTYDFKTAETATKESLERQLENYQANLQALQDAIKNGTPGVTQEMVDQAEAMVKAAQDELDKAPDDYADTMAKAGDSAAKAFGSDANKKTALESGKALKGEANKGLESDGSETTAGNNFGEGYANGILDKTPYARTSANTLGSDAVKGLNEGQESNSPSKATHRSGEYFGQGFIDGMESKKNSIWDKAVSLAKKAIAGLKAGQQEGSPSKLTYKSGVFFVQGYINGILSEEKNLQKVVQNMVATVIKELANVNNYDFSKAGENASTAFSNAMSKQADYMLKKMQYQNDQKTSEFDTKISSIQKKSDKKVSQIESKRDKRVNTIQKKIDKLGNSDSDKATKKKLQNQIKKIKNNATKQIDAEKAAAKKLIAEQNKQKTAYQKASSEMISEFTDAMNQYQSKAQELIDNTINGITEKYNQRYDELVDKQNNLIEKLKSAGSLFDISGAGVMTINDLQEQTRQIREYTSKLAKIKEKVSSELFDQITQYDMKEGSAFLDQLLAMSASDLDAYNKAYTEKMKAAEESAQAIYKKDFSKIASDYQNEINKAFTDIPKQLEELGNEAMQGFLNGLTENTDYMSKYIKTYVNSMVDTFKKDLNASGISIGAASTGIASTVNSGSSYNTAHVTNNYNLVQNNTSPKSLSALETYQARRQQVAMVKAMT